MSNTSGMEIVLRNCSLEAVAPWLVSVASPVNGPTEAGSALVYNTLIGKVVVQPTMEGPGGIGVWFNSAVLPWASTLDCARQAARELGCVVWCEPGEAYPEVDPLAPVFLEIDRGGERLVTIPDEDDT